MCHLWAKCLALYLALMTGGSCGQTMSKWLVCMNTCGLALELRATVSCGLGECGGRRRRRRRRPLFSPFHGWNHLWSLDHWGWHRFLHSQATCFSIWHSSGQSKNAISLSPTQGRHRAWIIEHVTTIHHDSKSAGDGVWRAGGAGLWLGSPGRGGGLAETGSESAGPCMTTRPSPCSPPAPWLFRCLDLPESKFGLKFLICHQISMLSWVSL